jgi:hypothetical protein
MPKVFINEDIFDSDGDYVIGGFSTEKVDGFTFADFYAALEERISCLVDDYLDEATDANIELGSKTPEKDALNDLLLLMNDNLDSVVWYVDKQSVIDAIMNDEKTQSWLFNIKRKVKAMLAKQTVFAPKYKGIYNVSVEMDTLSEAYTNAEGFTEDSTLEQVIEQISIIEL